MTPSHVLVPLDGSPLAGEALTHALGIFDCRVTVLNVITPMDAHMSEGGVLGADEERREAAHERANGLVERAETRAAAADRTIETAVRVGDSAAAILDYVEEHDVDHVVMGSHGGESHELTRRLLGTVATTVVGEAPVPVTVVR